MEEVAELVQEMRGEEYKREIINKINKTIMKFMLIGFLLIILMLTSTFFVNAQTVNETMQADLTQLTTGTSYFCIAYQPSLNITADIIYKDSQDQSTTWEIFRNDSGTYNSVLNGTFTSNKGTPNLAINETKKYLFCSHSGGLDRNVYYETVSYPSSENYGNFTNYCFKSFSGGSWDCSSYSYDISIYQLQVTYTTPVAGQPQLVLNTNLVNNSEFNVPFNFTFNGSIENTEQKVLNCSFYVNSALNYSFSDILVNTTNQINLTFPSVESYYTYRINCSNEVLNNSKGVYTIFYDGRSPVIDSTFENNTQYAQNEFLTIYANVTDHNITTFNITVLDSNNAIWESKQYTSDNLYVTTVTNTTSYTLTQLGNFSVMYQAKDTFNNRVSKTFKYTVVSSISVNNTALEGIYNETVKLRKATEMIWLIAFYITLLILSIYMILHYNQLAGYVLYGITFFLDFFIIYEIYTKYYPLIDISTIIGQLFSIGFVGFIVIWLPIKFFWVFTVKSRYPIKR